MKYKVGDKVVIRKDLKKNCSYGVCCFNEYMEKTLGTTRTILVVFSNAYRIDDDSAFKFTDEMIDHEATAKLNEPTLKSLLKSGDKVTYRDGTERWVLVETNSTHDRSGLKTSSLEYYDCNLFRSDKSFCHCDIMKIERGTELIWERVEKSAKQIEIEAIENEMKKLAERLEQVRKEM